MILKPKKKWILNSWADFPSLPSIPSPIWSGPLQRSTALGIIWKIKLNR